MKKRRWAVLGVFMGVAAVNQMLWLNFAPLQSMIHQRYQVSEFMAVLLTLCFPFLYLFFSMPAGAMTDRSGYRFTIAWSSVLMSAGAVVRTFDEFFYALLAGQIAIAVAQPYIMNGITKLAADWFPDDEQAIATGLGTAGMFTGMAIGIGSSAPLVEAYGLHHAMVIFAVLSVVATVLFLTVSRENEVTLNKDSRRITALQEFKHLIKNRALVMIFILSFLALGFFNGMATLLEGILGENGIQPADAGIVGAAMIIGGILGSLMIPALSDHFQRRKPFLIFCAFAGAALAYPLCQSDNLILLYFLAGLLGLLFLPGYALLLAMSEEIAGKERAGGAAGLLMLAGNAGGVVVISVMESLHGDGGWSLSVNFLMGTVILILLLAFFAPESIAERRSDFRR